MTGQSLGRLAGRSVLKMNGIGNEIVILDVRAPEIWPSAAEVRAVAARLAFDQLMVLGAPRTLGTAAYVRIYNADGSEAGACGNGTRCVAWVLLGGTSETRVTIETAAGLLACERLGPLAFSIDMGAPRCVWNEIPLSDAALDPAALDLGPYAGMDLPPAFALSMGNPHAVLFVAHVEAYDLAVIGSKLEQAPVFPQRANISLAEVVSRNKITLKVWERGAGATLGCGSAACAVLVAAVATGRTDRSVAIDLPGGTLDLTWRDDDHVVMAGPVAYEFDMVLTP